MAEAICISQEAELNSSEEILKRAIDKTSDEENIQALEENKDESNSVCTDFIEKDNNFMIQCIKCTGWLHYLCTKLPSYQIQLFVNTNCKFTCASLSMRVYQYMKFVLITQVTLRD